MKMSYRTADFPTICVLALRKHRILNIEKANPRRAIFEFQDSEQLRHDIEELQSGRLCVDPLDFWAAQRRCKQLLYGDELL